MPKKTPPLSYDVILSVLRIARGWPQKELADALGVGAPLLSGYESGDKTLSRKRLEEIVARMGLPAVAVDKTAEYLLSIRSLSPPEGGTLSGSARAEASVARVRDAAEVLARSLVALPAESRAEDARRQARDLWDRMKKVSPKERRALVKTTQEFRSWALCELVCERSLEAAADRADRALDLADLAVYIAQMAPGEQTWRKRLRGYALAHLANAKRVGGDLPAADQVFAKARKFWEAGEEAGVELLSEAQFLGLEASLRTDQRQLQEALTIIDRAMHLASSSERKKLLLKRANIFELTENFEGAISTLQEVAALISKEDDLRFNWLVRFSLANNLLHEGHPEEADAFLPELNELAARFGNELDSLRLRWLEGRVAAGLGRREKARAIISRVREDLITKGSAFDAALASLELASFYLEDGRSAEVRVLARQMLWIFKAQGVPREAVAALRLFREAAEKENLTLEMTRRLVAYFHRARHNPDLRFEVSPLTERQES